MVMQPFVVLCSRETNSKRWHDFYYFITGTCKAHQINIMQKIHPVFQIFISLLILMLVAVAVGFLFVGW